MLYKYNLTKIKHLRPLESFIYLFFIFVFLSLKIIFNILEKKIKPIHIGVQKSEATFKPRIFFKPGNE